MKTLAKIELRATWVMLIYFIVCGFYALSEITSNIQYYISTAFQQGIAEVMHDSYFITPSSLFNDNIRMFIALMCLGIIFLIYLSCKNDSNYETGRFLETLPFSSKQRYFTKIGVSLSIITLSYVIYAVLLLITRHYFLSKLKDIYEITLFSQNYTKLLPVGALLQFLVCFYLFVVAFYVFLVMMEYLISSNMISLVIGLLIGASPVFIAESMASIFRTNVFYSLQDIVNKYYESLLPSSTPTLVYTAFTAESSTAIYSIGHIEVLETFGIQCIAYLIIIGICIACSVWLCQRKILENTDILMPMSWFRWIFIVGVTVCSGLFLADIYLAFYARYTMEKVWLIVGGIVGFIVAWLIANKGFKTLRGIKK